MSMEGLDLRKIRTVGFEEAVSSRLKVSEKQVVRSKQAATVSRYLITEQIIA